MLVTKEEGLCGGCIKMLALLVLLFCVPAESSEPVLAFE